MKIGRVKPDEDVPQGSVEGIAIPPKTGEMGMKDGEGVSIEPPKIIVKGEHHRRKGS